MKKFLAIMLGVSIANLLNAGVLLENVEKSKHYAPWKSIESESYRLEVSHSGTGSLLLNKKLSFPIVPALIYNVYIYDSSHKKTGKAKIEFANKSWEEIKGDVNEENNNGKLIDIKAFSEIGIKKTVSINVASDIITAETTIKATEATEAFAYRFETAILNYFKLSSIPFTAIRLDGDSISGDFFQKFKTINKVEKLIITVKGKRFQIDFEGLDVSIKSTPGRVKVPVVLSMYPENIKISSPLMPGSSFSYRIIVKVLHDESHEQSKKL